MHLNQRFIFISLLPILVFGIYFPVLSNPWTWDDSSILEHVYRYSPWDYFFVPEAWRELSPVNLTPWVSLSFDLDFALFGLEPQGYYWHQLVSLSLVSIALFLVLSLWLNPTWGLAGAILWLSSAPTQTLAQQLMTRHYLEGLGFALLALFFYVKALRTERWHWLIGSTVFYALACSAKEVYVPLILLLPFLPEATFRHRFGYVIPLGIVAAAYVVWRFYMLGVTVGGYGHPMTWQTVVGLPLQVIQKLFGSDPIILTITLFLIVFFMIYALWSYVAARWLVPLVLFIILAPLIPAQHHLVHADTYRLLVLPSAVLAAGLVLIMGQSPSFMQWLHWRMVIPSVLPCLLMIQNFQAIQQLKPQIEKFAAHAEFIQHAPSNHVLLYGMNWADIRLRCLHQEITGKTPPSLVFDLSEIDNLEGKRFFSYEEKCACMQEVTQTMPQMLQDWRSKEKKAPLSIQLSKQNQLISWKFEPYMVGTYQLLNPKLFGLTALPAQGQVRAILPEPMRFRVRYDSPEGWHTYTPWLLFQHEGGGSIKYARNED